MSQTTVVRADAKSLTTIVNNNPSVFTYKFPRPLRDIDGLSLLRLCITRSPVVTLIRVSNTETFGTALGSQDAFHQLAVRMETALGSDPDKSSYVATITNPAATVSLRVHDVYTRTGVRTDGGNFRTYDVLICTGTVLTSTTTDWTITAEGEVAGTEITPSADNAVLTVHIAPQSAILRVQLNGNLGIGRVQEAFNLAEDWMTYRMYYPGQIVNFDNNKYVCSTKHLSLVFARDLAAGLWNSTVRTRWATGTSYALGSVIDHQGSIYACRVAHTAGSFTADFTAGRWTFGAVTTPIAQPTSAACDAFEVFDFGSDPQTTETVVYLPEHIRSAMAVQSLDTIRFEWVQRNGRPFMFPYTPCIRLTTLESTSDYTFEREYAAPCVQLQITHRAFNI